MRAEKTGDPRVLIIDRDSLKQKLRATVFRNCEIAVHAIDNHSEALRLCKTQRYALVLLGGNSEEASLICAELHKISPRQRVALLVGPPAYLREIGTRRASAGRAPISLLKTLPIVEPEYFGGPIACGG